MSRRLWGFASQYLGNETALFSALPIVHIDADGDRWLVPRGARWTEREKSLVVDNELEASSLGTRLEPPPPWEVRDGDELVLMGPTYFDRLSALGIQLPERAWYLTNSNFRVAIGADGELEGLSRAIDEQVIARFWQMMRAANGRPSSAQAAKDPGRVQRSGDQLLPPPVGVLNALSIIGASPTADRLEYFSASLATKKRFEPKSNTDVSVTLALGAVELGVDERQLEMLLDSQIAVRLGVHARLHDRESGRKVALTIARVALGLDAIEDETYFYRTIDGTLGVILDEESFEALRA